MTVQYTLSSPVEFNDVEYKDLTFRTPLVADLMVADAFRGQTSKAAAVLSSISDVPMPAFKKIGARDFNKILVATDGLLGEPPSAEIGA